MSYVDRPFSLNRALAYIGEATRWSDLQSTGHSIIHNEPWQVPPLGADYSIAGPQYPVPAYRGTEDGFVHLRGRMAINLVGGDSLPLGSGHPVFGLQPDHAPAWEQWLPAPAFQIGGSGNRTAAVLHVDESGLIWVRHWGMPNDGQNMTGGDVGGSWSLILDGLLFWPDV